MAQPKRFYYQLEACLFNEISSHCFVHSASLDRHSHSPVTGKTAAGKGREYVQPEELKACRLKKPQQLLDLDHFILCTSRTSNNRQARTDFQNITLSRMFPGSANHLPQGTATKVSHAGKAKHLRVLPRASHHKYLSTTYSHKEKCLQIGMN